MLQQQRASLFANKEIHYMPGILLTPGWDKTNNKIKSCVFGKSRVFSNGMSLFRNVPLLNITGGNPALYDAI